MPLPSNRDHRAIGFVLGFGALISEVAVATVGEVLGLEMIINEGFYIFPPAECRK